MRVNRCCLLSATVAALAIGALLWRPDPAAFPEKQSCPEPHGNAADLTRAVKAEYNTHRFDATKIVSEYIRSGDSLIATLCAFTRNSLYEFNYNDRTERYYLSHFFFQNWLIPFNSEIRILLESEDDRITGTRAIVFYHAL